MQESNLFFAVITPEEASSISGGFLNCTPPSGIFFRVPGTDKKYYFGDYNDNPQTNFSDVVWEIRKGKETCAKGYGETPKFVKDLADKFF